MTSDQSIQYHKSIEKIFPSKYLSSKKIDINDVNVFITSIVDRSKMSDILSILLTVTPLTDSSHKSKHHHTRLQFDNTINSNISDEILNDVTALKDKYSITSTRLKDILFIVCSINNLLFKMNSVIDYKNTFITKCISSNCTNITSPSKNYTVLSTNQRSICLIILLIVLTNMKKSVIEKFLSTINKLSSSKNIFDLFHVLSHTSTIESHFITCITDAYIFIKICQTLITNNYPNNYLTRHVFTEKCSHSTCNLLKFTKHGSWLTIIQAGLYLKKFTSKQLDEKEVAFNIDDYRNFVRLNDNIIELLGYIYLSQSNYKYLYTLGYIYSIMFNDNNIPSIDASTDINPKYFDQHNNIAVFKVKTIDKHSKKENYIYELVENNKSAYIYRSMYSNKDLNLHEIIYKNNDNLKSVISKSYTDVNKFSTQKMASFSEVIGYAIGIILIVVIALVVYDKFLQNNHPKLGIKKSKNGKVHARVDGMMNEHIPENVIS